MYDRNLMEAGGSENRFSEEITRLLPTERRTKVGAAHRKALGLAGA